MENLTQAFPEKTSAERKQIAKEFYRNFIDTLLETIKMLSLRDNEFASRCTIDSKAFKIILENVNNIQFHGSHQMNWEYANLILAKSLPIPLVGLYMPITNKAVNRIFYNIRTRYKTELISTIEFRSRMHTLFRNQYALALAPDQNASSFVHAYWLNFFNKESPFATAPDKMAIRNKAAVVFVQITKVKRGYYHFDFSLITNNAGALVPGELTIKYRDFLETIIRKQPANYLWSHRRWKHTYEKQFEKRWIDSAPTPI